MKKLLPMLVLTFIFGTGLLVFNKRQVPDSSKNITKTSSSVKDLFDKNKYSMSDPSSLWVVVNKSRALSPIAYAPTDLKPVGSGQTMRQEAGDAFLLLVEDASSQGLKLSPLSGYRSYETQAQVYNNEVRINGQTKADTESARAGHSEHQTGLAIDVGGGGCNIDDCFGNTKEGQWVAAHAYEYGFIVRYVSGKETITGYRAEPWHLRYIGTELSKELRKQNVLTLEEFFNL